MTFQVTLFLDGSGALRAEAPSLRSGNGARRKLHDGEAIPVLTNQDKIALANLVLADLADQARSATHVALANAKVEAARRKQELTLIRAVAEPAPGLTPRKALTADQRADLLAYSERKHPRQTPRWFPNKMPGETRKAWQIRVGAVNAKPTTKGTKKTRRVLRSTGNLAAKVAEAI